MCLIKIKGAFSIKVCDNFSLHPIEVYLKGVEKKCRNTGEVACQNRTFSYAKVSPIKLNLFNAVATVVLENSAVRQCFDLGCKTHHKNITLWYTVYSIYTGSVLQTKPKLIHYLIDHSWFSSRIFQMLPCLHC